MSRKLGFYILSHYSKYGLLLFALMTCSFCVCRYYQSGLVIRSSPSFYTANYFFVIRRNHTVSRSSLRNNQTQENNHVSVIITPPKVNSTIQNATYIAFSQVGSILRRTPLKVDQDFARRLRKAQRGDIFPLVNDIVVSKRNNSWAIYVIINNGNTNNRYRYVSSTNVELFIGNKSYRNIFPQSPKRFLRVLKYKVDSLPTTGKLTLHDHFTSHLYPDLPYVALSIQPKRRIAVCAYISNYNSINEIKSLLAFYLLQKIDAVILYCAVNYKRFREAFDLEIRSGFVILYEYPWPLKNTFGSVQYSVQGSHINSCFYRHRDYFQYIISQDVDEYFYSEKYPYDLNKAAQELFMLYPDKGVLIVCRSGKA